MASYDASHFDPPAPAARVTLRDPENGATVSDVPLLLDTGADVTLLPLIAIERLGVSVAHQRHELIGFDHNKSFAPAAMLDLIFLRRAFRGRYLLIEDDRGILGRDILNHLTLLFDGPGQKWSEHSP
jgi:hypothetical protein